LLGKIYVDGICAFPFSIKMQNFLYFCHKLSQMFNHSTIKVDRPSCWLFMRSDETLSIPTANSGIVLGKVDLTAAEMWGHGLTTQEESGGMGGDDGVGHTLSAIRFRQKLGIT
jgi:hypothetical protein